MRDRWGERYVLVWHRTSRGMRVQYLSPGRRARPKGMSGRQWVRLRKALRRQARREGVGVQ